MARPTRVDYSGVDGIIDAMLAAGERPSVQKIRDQLGRGSFSTIADFLHARGLSAMDLRTEQVSTTVETMPVPIVSIPAPDQTAVTVMIQLLRATTQQQRAEAMAQHFGGISNGRP